MLVGSAPISGRLGREGREDSPCISHGTEVPCVAQGDTSPAQLEWLGRDPLSERPRVAGVDPHETLHPALPLSGAGHHGVCAGADGRVRTPRAWPGRAPGGQAHTHDPLSSPTETWHRWGSRYQDTRSAFFAVFRDSRTESHPHPPRPQRAKMGPWSLPTALPSTYEM